MRWPSELGVRVSSLFRRDRMEADMAEEMRFHLEMEAAQLEARGLSPAEARREAAKRFGAVSRYEEEVRDERGARMVEDAWQDLRYGVRMLRRRPGMAAMLIVTLGLGIGAATAVFSIVNSVLLKPLPYPESERLVILREIERNNRPNWASHPNFVDWREQATRSFESMTSVAWPEYVTVLGGTAPVRVPALGVSREYFEVAQVAPFLGRTIAPEENREGGAATVVVSHGFWQQYLGGERNLASRTLELNGEMHQVVGVMPAGFRFMGDVGLWFGYERAPNPNRSGHAYRIVARLKRGVSVASARAEMSALSQLLLEEYGTGTRAVDVYINPLHEEAVSGSRGSLLLLLGAAGLLLLVSCTNVASTLLARGMAREQEIAVRASMGAGRLRLVRQLFTESLVIAAGGVLLGVALAYAAVRVFATMGAGRVPRIHEVAISPGVLLFSIAVSLVAAVLFGLLPAVRLADGDVAAQMRAGTRGNTAASSRALWRGLVGAEIAMATILLIGAGLLVRSLVTILRVDVGYRTENVLTADLSLPAAKYGDSARIQLFYERLLPELAALPGVESIGLTNKLPLQYGSWTANTWKEGAAGDGATQQGFTAGWRLVNTDYFRTLNIPVLRGRAFEPGDREGALAVAIVNEPLASKLWPGEDPIGKRVRNGFDPRGQWFTVVGVVGHARSWVTEEQLEMYLPYVQRPEHAAAMTVLVATRGSPQGLAEPVRERIGSLDPDVPAAVATLGHMVNDSVAGHRFLMLVLAAFALTALLLAVIGVYGVMSYAVARRRREIGIRLALGQAPRSVRLLIQREALLIAAVGVTFGAIGSVAASRIIRSMLYEVQPTDPVTFAASVALLLIAAAAASYLPARRSTGVDPMITMRAE